MELTKKGIEVFNHNFLVPPFQWFAHATFCKSEVGKDQQFLQHKLPKEVAAYGMEHKLLMPYFHSKQPAGKQFFCTTYAVKNKSYF